MKNVEKSFPIICIVIALLLMALFGYQATKGPLSEVEAYGFQVLSLVIGLSGSYVFGRRIRKDVIREIVEPHARSAFRRLISLYRSISRVARITEGDNSDQMKVALIRAIVIEQIQTADDALEDWRDLVPASIEELRKTLRVEVPDDE